MHGSVAYHGAYSQPTHLQRGLNRWRHISFSSLLVIYFIKFFPSLRCAGCAGIQEIGYRMVHEMRMNSRFWCNSRQDVGTHGCLSFGHSARAGVHICIFKWMCVMCSAQRWLTSRSRCVCVCVSVRDWHGCANSLAHWNQRTIWFTILSSYFFWACTLLCFILLNSSQNKWEKCSDWLPLGLRSKRCAKSD